MTLRCRTMVLAASVVFVPCVVQAQSLLVGRVVSDSGQPIAGATVTLKGVRYSVRTDTLGHFRLNGTPGSTQPHVNVSDDSGRFDVPITVRGRASVLVRRIGFEPAEVVLTEMPDTAMQVQMRAVARTLEAQVVTVRSPFARLDRAASIVAWNRWTKR